LQDYPLVSITILNYNGLSLLDGVLEECLQSVLGTDYPNIEVLFVDNASVDESVDFVSKSFSDSRLKIIRNSSNLGVGEGYNVGMRASRGEYIVQLNDDIIVDPDWLKELVGVKRARDRRSRFRFMIKNWEIQRLFPALAVNIFREVSWFICSVIRLRPRLYILTQMLWNFLNLRSTWKKRLEVKQLYAHARAANIYRV